MYGLAIIYVCGRLKFGLATNAGLIKKIEVYNVHAMYALRYNKVSTLFCSNQNQKDSTTK